MIQDREDAIIARLDREIEGARCAAVPTRLEHYKLARGRKTELFVSYRGSRPKDRGTVDLLGQARVETWDVHLVTRDLRDHTGAYRFLDAIRQRLFGWECPGAYGPMVPDAQRFTAHHDGVWTFLSTFEHEVIAVADPDAEILPLLKRITTVDDDGETNTIESEGT
jgi:hypothetical protein